MDAAACRGMDTARFFPERGAQTVPEDIARVCRTCPVLEECRIYAAVRFDLQGIWAGLNHDERKRLRRRRRAS
jgi:WhiB family redox-sensing transcriptional regulator